MARSTRRSKPDQRGAETLGGLPAQLHAIRKVGFDQLVRENALQRHRRRGSCLLPLEGLEKLGAALAFLAELERVDYGTGRITPGGRGDSERNLGRLGSAPRRMDRGRWSRL